MRRVGWLLLGSMVLLAVVLVQDFRAGLDEDRLWSDPSLDDPESFGNRAA
ncbi:MAG: hypothetical protein WD602_03895 [Actinomycetota bacterium]